MQRYVVFIYVIEELVGMVKGGFVTVLLTMSNLAFANCEKTLMGNDCESNSSGLATHMRGNAVANAKAAKELQLVKAQAKKEASAIAAKK
jgi:hypothetical protein